MDAISFGLCKDCQHWGRSADGVCDWIGMDDDDPAYADVFVHDDSGLYIEFKTQPNFGCTLFKKKE